MEESTNYFRSAVTVLNKIIKMYPNYKLKLTGHSLGGAMTIKVSENLSNNNFDNFESIVFNPYDSISLNKVDTLLSFVFYCNNYDIDGSQQKEYIKNHLYSYKFNKAHKQVKYYSYLGDISSVIGSSYFPWVKIIDTKLDRKLSLLERHYFVTS